MKNAGKARSYGLYRHLRTSKEIIENLLNYYNKNYYTEADSAASHKQTAGSTEYFGDRIPPEFR